MRIWTCGVLMFSLAAGAACGWGSLVASYASPADSPQGLGYISTSYMCLTTNTPDYVWRLNRSNGAVVASFPAPGPEATGCAYGAVGTTGYIFVCDPSADRIYRQGWNSGSLYGSYPSPAALPLGVGFRADGADYYVYNTDYGTKHLYQLNATSGSVYASYNLGYTPRDCDFGRGYLWVADAGNGLIRALTTTASTVASFPSRDGPPFGVGYDAAADYVWVCVAVAVNRVYVYETVGMAVAPASVGRIKALYR